MNECEMQIQLRQPSSPAQLPTSSQTQVVHHHRSRLEPELNLQKRQQNHVLDLKVKNRAPTASAEDRCHPAFASRSVSAATVQNLLESFDQRIRQTKCINMSSEQARLAGIPSPGTTTSSALRCTSPANNPSTNPAAAAALMLLKNRIIPPVSLGHHNGIDLSSRSSARAGEPPKGVQSETASNKKGHSNGNHIPPNTSPGSAHHGSDNNNHSSPSSSSGASSCNSPPSNGSGNGGNSSGGGQNGSVGKPANGGRLQFFKGGCEVNRAFA